MYYNTIDEHKNLRESLGYTINCIQIFFPIKLNKLKISTQQEFNK